MFVTRPTAPRFYYSLAAVFLATCFASKAVAQSGERMATCWRHAANERSTNAHARRTNSAWQSPNGQPAATASQPDDRIESAASEADSQKSAAAPPEPRAFQPPANVKRIAAAQRCGSKPTQTSTASSAANAIGGRGQGPGRGRPRCNKLTLSRAPMPANRPAVPQQPAHQRVSQAKGAAAWRAQSIASRQHLGHDQRRLPR